MNFVEKEFYKLSQWLTENGYSDLRSEKKIICPICQKSKSLEFFSKEHIAPASIGGNQLTITCNDCNAKCGHEFDYTIANFLNHMQLSLGGSNCKSEVIVDNISLNAIVENTNGSPCIFIKEENNHPEKWKSAQNSLNISGCKFKLNTSSKWSLQKLFRALFKMAQLMSIPQENYRYILNECGQTISDIILGKYDGDISRFVRIISSISSENELPVGYCTATFERTEIRFCFIKLKREIKQDYIYFMVFLPGDNCSWPEFTAATQKITELSKDHSINIAW